MPHERVDETRAWLAKARQDLEAAELLLTVGTSLAEPALYHCQQAAEKALKAYLVWRDRPFAKTHDLVALVSLCVDIESEFASLEGPAIALTPYAVAFRYPGETPAPTSQQSREAVGLARKVFAFVLDRLPPAVRN